METHCVVGNPRRQGQGEEDVGDDQVEGVQGGGVHLLQIGTDDMEGEAVTEQSNNEHDAIEKRDEDLGIVPVGVQGVTGGIIRLIAGGRGVQGHIHSGRSHLDIFATNNSQMEVFLDIF